MNTTKSINGSFSKLESNSQVDCSNFQETEKERSNSARLVKNRKKSIKNDSVNTRNYEIPTMNLKLDS